MAASKSDSSSSGVGKDPTEVDEEQPDDDTFRQFMDEQIPEVDLDESEESELPSREELWQVVKKQQDHIEDLQKRVSGLEAQIEEVEQEADTIEEVAEQFRKGKIGGEAGAAFIQEFVTVPDSQTMINARTKRLFFKIIEERMVGKAVTSSKVIQWLGLQDSSNPSVKAKRIMERLERHRQDGYLIGTIETGKYRGKNCIWLKRQ